MATNGETATQRDIERLREDIHRMHSESAAVLGRLHVTIDAIDERLRVDTAAIHSRIETEQHRTARIEAELAEIRGIRQGKRTLSQRLTANAGLGLSVLGIAATWVTLILARFA